MARTAAAIDAPIIDPDSDIPRRDRRRAGPVCPVGHRRAQRWRVGIRAVPRLGR